MKIIISLIFMSMLLSAFVFADIQKVEVPLTIQIKNTTFTIFKTEDNSQYPYSTSCANGTNTDTSYSLTLTTYKNYTNICPEVSAVENVCNSALSNLSSSVVSLSTLANKKDYYDEYINCKSDKDVAETKLSDCNFKFADYPTLKTDRDNCINLNLPNAQQSIKDKDVQISTLQTNINSLEKTNDGLKNERYFWFAGGALLIWLFSSYLPPSFITRKRGTAKSDTSGSEVGPREP